MDDWKFELRYSENGETATKTYTGSNYGYLCDESEIRITSLALDGIPTELTIYYNGECRDIKDYPPIDKKRILEKITEEEFDTLKDFPGYDYDYIIYMMECDDEDSLEDFHDGLKNYSQEAANPDWWRSS